MEIMLWGLGLGNGEENGSYYAGFWGLGKGMQKKLDSTFESIGFRGSGLRV